MMISLPVEDGWWTGSSEHLAAGAEVSPRQQPPKGIVDPDKQEALRVTESVPFMPGPNRRLAVKVIDIFGNEVVSVKRLE